MTSNVIILGGPGGSGRSTLAKQLCEILKFERIYGGAILRDLSLKHGYGIKNENNELVFNEEMFVKYHEEYVPNHPEIDLNIDTALFEAAHRGNIVIESMTFAPLTKRLELPYVRVWITADEDERAKRIVERELKGNNKFTVEEMKEITKNRALLNQKRWQALYGFDFLDYNKYYDYSFDTTNVAQEEMGQKLYELIKDAIKN